MEHSNSNQEQQQQQQQQQQQIRRAISPSSAPAAVFRSQRIQQQQQFAVEPPLLMSPQASQGLSAMAAKPSSRSSTSPSSEATMVGTIPVLPSVHILERTAIQVQPEQMTSKTLLDRIFTYLRRNSIVVVQCDQDTGCLECIFRSPTTGSSVEFVIQLWRAVRSHHYHYQQQQQQQQQYFLWVEIQRRQGCCIEMNSLRRSLIQYIMNGDAQVATEDVFQAQGQRTRPRPALDDMTNESHRKRPKTAPSPAVGVNCQDSLAITLRLLESPYKNQQKLGLESLVISTNAALVSQGNATVVSHALVEGDGPWGGRLQQRLAVLLRQVQPAPRGTGHFPANRAGNPT